MIFINNLTNKQIVIILIAVTIIICTIGLYFYKTVFLKKDDEEYEKLDEIASASENNNMKEQTPEGEDVEHIIIHITGSVKKQGIVILKPGKRIIDAIDAAGGATDDADLNKLNLAYELQDGEKLYVPSINDSEDKEILVNGGGNYVLGSYGISNEERNKRININKATKEELQSLNGVGESMANKIIKYREENGKFNDIEDIKNVPGIGDSKYENIKDYITVK